MCSAGTWTRPHRARSSTPSSTPASTPSTPPTAIRAGRPAMSAASSEIVIGKWLKASGKRDKVVIATKFGEDMGEGRSLRKDYILRACEASLRRLQTDTIDLYQTHFDDDVTPVEETMEAFAQLIQQGKVRASRRLQCERRRGWRPRSPPARSSASRATKWCSRSTAWSSASASSATTRRSAGARSSASSPIIRWPPASSPASTAPPPTLPAMPPAAAR